MSDPIADMLARIRNAYGSRLPQTSVPYSKVKVELAELLKRKGLIGEVKVNKEKYEITLSLIYHGDTPAITYLKRISRPGLRVYKKISKVRRVRSGLGMVVISTSKGLMTGEEAKKAKLGGEILAEVW
ncbi:MAG TPA: 30S ribosomal protein S8 [Patescibacteria group bacterium]|nr:30S ribosomal protein S8 [Patescibacteria group bacterium]